MPLIQSTAAKKSHTIVRSKKVETLLTTFFVKDPYFIKETSVDSATSNIILYLPRIEDEELRRLLKFFYLWFVKSGITLEMMGNKIFGNAMVTFPNENTAKQFLFTLITLQKLHLPDDNIKSSYLDLVVSVNDDSSLDHLSLLLGSESNEHNKKESNVSRTKYLYGNLRGSFYAPSLHAPTEMTICTSLSDNIRSNRTRKT